MSRHIGAKVSSREVRLVRVSPYDSRTVRKFKSRSDKKIKALLLTAIVFVCVCLGAAYFIFRPESGAGGDTAMAMHKGRPAEILQEPEQIPAEEIVVLAEEEHTPRIAIDPGHGGEDEGCSWGSVLEKEINLELALLLEEKLQDMGFQTVLIRADDDTQLTLQERVELAEEGKADIYVSIHQNSYEGKGDSVSGIETWYCEDSQGSRRLAQLIHKGAVQKTGARDREIRETEELYVTREASMPSCLIETGFLTNTGEREAIVTPEYQRKIVDGIAQGIDYYPESVKLKRYEP